MKNGSKKVGKMTSKNPNPITKKKKKKKSCLAALNVVEIGLFKEYIPIVYL